ncbi:MAG: hypothetical protein WCV82_03580 [Candidatus Paceibacterota bacterium]
MKKVFLTFLLGLIPVAFVFGSAPVPVWADTYVGGIISHDTVWSVPDSPYLLDSDVTIPDDVTLTVGPGVVIRVAPEVDQEDPGYDPSIYVSGGRLDIAGDDAERVAVEGIGGIYVSGGSMNNGSASVAYADLSGGSRLSFENARGTIASSSVTGAYIGISSRDSIIYIRGSRISGNEVGIDIAPHNIFQLSIADDRFGTGGIGNALADAPNLSASSSLDISGSIISGNTDRAIRNMAEFTVAAQHDWWGSPAGPDVMPPNSIQGSVEYMPWLMSEPDLSATDIDPQPCCSSVLFIPGIEGSRLYRSEQRPLGLGMSVNQLWEPNRNADVKKLYLNPSGSSSDSSIYSGGPIDKALGLVDIYGGFMGFMDGLVRQGSMNEWRAFGYDWRKPIAEVVAGREKKASTTENLIKVVEDLANGSKTGQVSIVAHSNGGLVTKYLVKVLSDMGKSELIDSVISVAVPYLGTPEAIPALLHGDGQALLGGLIMSRTNARTLGSNMASAYSLLPSRGFFSKAFSPTIAFASTNIQNLNEGAYPESIDSFDGQYAFIADTAKARPSPNQAKTLSPIRGNQLLMKAADALHGILDPFVWPSTIARWAIVGWNSTTTEGILYSDKGHTVLRDLSGDGTVKAQSAGHESGQTFSLNLKEQTNIDRHDISHVNILESSTTKAAIGAILTSQSNAGDPDLGDNPAAHNTEVIDEVSKLPGVTVGQLDWNAMDAAYNANRNEIRVSTHSPVKLHVYDSSGNHTGEIPLPAEVAAQVEPGLYTMKEERVPGSTYDVLGCEDEEIGDCDTQITLPDNGERYTAVVDGVGTGTFTLDIERVRGTSTIERIEWRDVPVTAQTRATTTFMGYPSFAVSRTQLTSSSSPLTIDINGNGTTDAISSPGSVLDIKDKDGRSPWSLFKDCLKRLRAKNMRDGDRKKIFDEAKNILKRFR